MLFCFGQNIYIHCSVSKDEYQESQGKPKTSQCFKRNRATRMISSDGEKKRERAAKRKKSKYRSFQEEFKSHIIMK